MKSYYTRQGYALLISESHDSEHWFGGEAYHLGATCPVCKIPLLLIADIDCVPFRVQQKEKLFHKLSRIPFYYCWRCCAENISYKIEDSDKIEILKNKGSAQDEDFPYEKFPQSFPRKPIKIVPILYEVAKLLAVSQEIDEYWLSAEDNQEIQKELAVLRHSGFSKNDINRHQIEGLLNLIQGHENIQCSNKECKNSSDFAANYGARMKELAVIHNDPFSGLPMVEAFGDSEEKSNFNEWVQLVYWICEECLSITVSNRCD